MRGIVGAACVSALLAAPALAVEPVRLGATAVPGELIVQFDPRVSGSERAEARRRAGVRAERSMLAPGQQVVSVVDGGSTAAALARLERDPRVRYAQPNYIRRKRVSPNDPRFVSGEQWGLFADRIAATLAWERTTGDSGVTVAIVDEGVAYDHPDLAANMLPGRDFVDGDDDPRDFGGHGTHVAGIAAAAGNNGLGIAGVTWRSKILPIRVLDFAGGTDDAVADGFRFAGGNGARVVNASLGGPGFSQAMSDAIAAYPNTLFVVAAANDSANSDQKAGGDYPCNFTHANLICVAATDQSDVLAGTSGYGPVSVDLGAPGVNVLSTYLTRVGLFDDFEDPVSFATDWGGASSDWGLTTEQPPDSSVTDSPAGEYARNSVATLQTAKVLNFTGRRGCSLRLELALDTPDLNDFLAIEVSRDGGAWAELGKFSDTTDSDDPGNLPDFVPLELDLDADNQKVRLRFRLVAGDDPKVGDGAYIDNVDAACVAPDEPQTYASHSGTSMATPHVAGAAALVLSARPTLSVTQLRDLLLSSGDPLPSLAGKTVTGRRLDVNAALSAPADPPAAPSPISPRPIEPRTEPPLVDRVAPRVSFRPTRGQRLRTLVRRGLRGIVGCNEACTVRLRLVVDARTARRLRLTRRRRAVVAGRSRISVRAATRRRVTVRVKRRSKSRLMRARSVRFTVRVTAVDRAGNRRTISRRVRLRR